MAEELRELISKQPIPVKRLSLAALISILSGIATHVLIFMHSLIGIKFLTSLVLGSVLALVAIIAGHFARRKIRKGDRFFTGIILADIGLVLGYILIILLAMILVLTLLGVGGIIATLGGLFG